MNNLFYPKMALTNLKKNATIYVPYLITCICSIITFYIMCAIYKNDGLEQMPGASSLRVILGLGTIVIGIFSVIFLFYTNSFLIKRRKKELGLYSILGMEKKHIAKVLFYETLLILAASMSVGLIGGLLFSKLMFLILLNILKFNVSLQFSISYYALAVTFVLFTVIFLFTLLANLWQVKRSSAISLLKGGQQGEKEPKTKWILTIIGIITLGAGYYIAVTVKSPLAAFNLFFIAVILVIIGTYALFTAGSIAFLKLLRKNKAFYYKSKNFVSVSGMIYRMKQNAIGLSNICILSTMVLVTLSTTVSLYIGKDDLLRNRYPQDIKVEYTGNEKDQQTVKELVTETAKKNKITVMDYSDYRNTEFLAQKTENTLASSDSKSYQNKGTCVLSVIPLEDYNRITGQQETLEADELLVCATGNAVLGKKMVINGKEFKIKKTLEALDFVGDGSSSIVDGYYLIAKDMDTILSVSKESNTNYMCSFNIKGSNKNNITFAKELQLVIKKEITGYQYVDSIHLSEQEFYAVYGGFLFIGLFLGALFMMATVLIIYYKQISEGYDDHDRFQIMQKVGLSKREVKHTIQHQIVMVFFLPLAGAVIHICFAFGVISKLLVLFNLTNTRLFMICTFCTVLVFAAIYGLVYAWTAKVYYKLVQG